MDISLVEYSPQNSDSVTSAKLVECYRDVFAARPWNEWLKCPGCNAYWGMKDRGLLASWNYRHCNVPLVDFWPREQVLHDIRHEITSAALCTLAVAQDEVVGFCWGYPIAVADLEVKLGLPLNGLGFAQSDLVGYQDEIGVLSPYRGMKVAREMNKTRIQSFEKAGLRAAVSRVRRAPESSVTFLWYTGKLGYRVLAEYPNEDGRVVLWRRIEGLADIL